MYGIKKRLLRKFREPELKPIERFETIFYKYIQCCGRVLHASVFEKNFKITIYSIIFDILLCVMPVCSVYTIFVADEKSIVLCLPLVGIAFQVSKRHFFVILEIIELANFEQYL